MGEEELPQIEERHYESVVLAPPKATKKDSIISDNVVIKGSISTSSNIEIAGIIEGDVISEGDVSISGNVTGNITGLNIILRNCETKGNIVSSLSVSQHKNNTITGNISAVNLDMAGTIYGNIIAAEGVVLQCSASIVGDIEARSISVFKGAVVNGKIQIASN